MLGFVQECAVCRLRELPQPHRGDGRNVAPPSRLVLQKAVAWGLPQRRSPQLEHPYRGGTQAGSEIAASDPPWLRDTPRPSAA